MNPQDYVQALGTHALGILNFTCYVYQNPGEEKGVGPLEITLCSCTNVLSYQYGIHTAITTITSIG